MHASKHTNGPILSTVTLDMDAWHLPQIQRLSHEARGYLMDMVVWHLKVHGSRTLEKALPPMTAVPWSVVEELTDAGVIDDEFRLKVRLWHTSTEDVSTWVDRNPKHGYVYVLESHPNGEHGYKIGRSKNVPTRLRAIGTKMPFPVRLLHHFPCDDAPGAEAALHRSLSDWRVHGEWFDFKPTATDEQHYMLASLLDVKEYRDGMFFAEYPADPDQWDSTTMYLQGFDSCHSAWYSVDFLWGRYVP